MRRRHAVLALALAALLLVGGHAALVLTAAPMLPVERASLLPDEAAAPVDESLWIARAFAPVLLHETDRALGRQDVPAAMDFDGDRDATDNWEEMPAYALVPTVYYTVVGSATHYFVSYHLYHPRDWSRVALGLQDTHEGDGENVQVVVDRSTMSPVILTTQAHYRMWSYAPHPGPVTSGEETLRSDFEVELGRPVVFVESGGHGIYGSRDPRASNRLASLADPVVRYHPQLEGEPLVEPRPPWTERATYRLVSLPLFLGNSTDHPDLFAGTVANDRGDTPRYHKGDRYSGPLGPSRGISPFAMSYGWSRAQMGSLFWEPAATYADALVIEGNWSRETNVHPFRS